MTGHMSFFAPPGPSGTPLKTLRCLLVAAMLVAWFCCYPAATKVRSFAAAAVYSFIEFSFTTLQNGKGFTSFAQFWGNLLYTPILLDVYYDVIVSACGSSDNGPENAPPPTPTMLAYVTYVLLFPVNVWLLELVLDRLFLVVYGRNVAWCYCTDTDSYAGGTVRLGHGKYWLAMGAACAMLQPNFRDATDSLFT